MKMSAKVCKQKQEKESEFSWSDDELQLLLEAALDCKAKCEFEGIRWESKLSKYIHFHN